VVKGFPVFTLRFVVRNGSVERPPAANPQKNKTQMALCSKLPALRARQQRAVMFHRAQHVRVRSRERQ